MANTLNIKDFKQTKRTELHKEIVEAVKDTQRVIIQTLPDELLMTEAQFKILQPDMTLMYQSDQFMYMTPMNVMQVRVE